VVLEVPPSPLAVSRALEIAGPHARLATVRRLVGGTHADTYLIRTTHPERGMVLREFPTNDGSVANEAFVLGALDTLGGLAPRLLATGLETERDERPWLLISELSGTADLFPHDTTQCASELGQTLARIHATPIDLLSGLQRILERPRATMTGLAGPATAPVVAGWKHITDAHSVLTHSDFWSGNVTWEQGKVQGVVDWNGGAIGPPGFDLGWCRLDLVLLYDEDVADVFLDSYETAIAGALPHPLLWDLWAMARSYEAVETWTHNYCALGRDDLTEAELRRRHSDWTNRLLGAL
jgi:aminoglycoside phosphotransferase (APT) family kinase protein